MAHSARTAGSAPQALMSPGAVAAVQQLSAPAPSPHSPAAGGALGSSRHGGHAYEPVDGAMVDEASRLLSSGIPISAMANGAGRTPLHAACARAHLPLMRIVVAAGIAVADLEAPDAGGVTPLMLAARSGDADAAPRLIELLLRAGVSVSAADAAGATALHYGAGSAASLAALLRRGADINCRDKTGVTPLMRAAGFGASASVRLLLAAGADVAAVDAAGRTAQAYGAAAAGIGDAALLDTLQPPLGLYSASEPGAAATVVQLLHRAAAVAAAAAMPLTPSGRYPASGGARRGDSITDEGTAPAGASVILPLLPQFGSSLLLPGGDGTGSGGRQPNGTSAAAAPELRHWWEWVWPFGKAAAAPTTARPSVSAPAPATAGRSPARGTSASGPSSADDPVQRAFVAAAPEFGAGAAFVMA